MDTRSRRESFGQEVRRLRKERHLSQRALADIASTNQSHLWSIEKGEVSVGLDVMCHIADALGVPLQELIKF